MKTVAIYGASDDLVEVEGDRYSEVIMAEITTIEPRWLNCYERGAAMRYHESKDAADKWHHENSGENRVGCLELTCEVGENGRVIGVIPLTEGE